MELNEGTRVDATRNGARTFQRNILVPASVLASCLLGFGFGLTRFVMVLKADLKGGGMEWSGILLLAAMIGSVAILVLLGCAALGFVAGTVLNAVVRGRRHSNKAASTP